MSAFGDPFGDIDRTRPGTPYVVDSDGWGWFAFFLFAAIPLLVLGLFVTNLSSFLAENILVSIILYFLVSIGVGFYLYRPGSAKHRTIGIIATVLTMLPMAAILFTYAIPFVILAPGVDAIFDFILIVGLCTGGEVFIFSLCRLLKNGAVHLALATVFLILGIGLLLIGVGTESDIINMANIRLIYALK